MKKFMSVVVIALAALSTGCATVTQERIGGIDVIKTAYSETDYSYEKSFYSHVNNDFIHSAKIKLVCNSVNDSVAASIFTDSPLQKYYADDGDSLTPVPVAEATVSSYDGGKLLTRRATKFQVGTFDVYMYETYPKETVVDSIKSGNMVKVAIFMRDYVFVADDMKKFVSICKK
ncbi:hypothetical protein Aeh1ORF113c [Aeromonas phage Aeh1]|uniref:Lipoprotein n=1 Tax=Aeromonas phage Aeh1 TaxID=2880362 RepID=Q76YX1_9CAUD|nr:hypothetical protein Aeh1p120 [Aeromonas phage Aeh1]AAQ17775.1 hypothetical protein Aeh1ORF113c [Aeromonas phage Aeh1]